MQTDYLKTNILRRYSRLGRIASFVACTRLLYFDSPKIHVMEAIELSPRCQDYLPRPSSRLILSPQISGIKALCFQVWWPGSVSINFVSSPTTINPSETGKVQCRIPSLFTSTCSPFKFLQPRAVHSNPFHTQSDCFITGRGQSQSAQKPNESRHIRDPSSVVRMASGAQCFAHLKSSI